MKKIIIGIGNQFRNDDAIGLKVIDLLTNQKLSNVFLHKVNTDIFSVDEIIITDKVANELKQVLFVDALLNDQLPIGSIVTMPYSKDLTEWKSASSTHEIGILEYLSLLSKMNMVLPKIFLMGIVVSDIGYGERISKEVLKSMTKATQMIEEWLNTGKFTQKVALP